MAAAHVKAAKKLTRVKIRAISLAGKALLEEDIFDRVLQVKWYEFVRQALGSQEVSEML